MAALPPNPLPAVNRIVLPAGTELHRIHDRLYAPDAFNPGIGPRLSRFAPIRAASGEAIPTLYGAIGFECAAHESIFHDILHDESIKNVAFTRLRSAMYSIIRLRRELTVASLFEPDLNAWRISRKDLIDTPPTDYKRTARWAEALHATGVDGLVWTSRRCDPDRAFVFFGDRDAADAFEIVSSIGIVNDPATLRQVFSFAVRAGIVITL